MLTNSSAIQLAGQHATHTCAVQGERQRCQKTSRQQVFCRKHKIYVTGGHSRYETQREVKSWSSLGVSYLSLPALAGKLRCLEAVAVFFCLKNQAR